MRGGARNAVAGRDEGQSVSSTRLPAISTTAVTMHPVPMDGTDGKVANEPSRVRVSVVEPSGTWTFGLGKNRDVSTFLLPLGHCESSRAALPAAHLTFVIARMSVDTLTW